ncbi:MAG: hypothetical protein KDA80_18575, partial [Planctomycetaceae bacterium]|nr:hypothetical protein [Planctomycetaceae bacterium]
MRTAIQTASDAFGVPFTPSSPPPIDGDRDWLVRPSGPCGHRVLLRGDREKNEWLEGEVSSPDTKLLDRLAATTILVIQQQDQLNCRDEETDSFIEQMGIAFEQLVWTRKLAETIESVEVRQ